jgi:hypothetical protein
MKCQGQSCSRQHNRTLPSSAADRMTETSTTVSHVVKGSGKYESVGGPIPNTEMKVVHPDTRSSVDARQTGEICVRGPQVRESFQVSRISILSFGVVILCNNFGCQFLSAHSPY